MAMINCPECENSVSDKAGTCPQCGCPLAAATTIEATGKRWKMCIVAGAVLSMLGIVLITQAMITAGVVSCIAGVALFIAGRAGSWWFHG